MSDRDLEYLEQYVALDDRIEANQERATMLLDEASDYTRFIIDNL